MFRGVSLRDIHTFGSVFFLDRGELTAASSGKPVTAGEEQHEEQEEQQDTFHLSGCN